MTEKCEYCSTVPRTFVQDCSLTLTRRLISMKERIFPKVITMGDVMDSTLMDINKGNAHGTQRERTKGA